MDISLNAPFLGCFPRRFVIRKLCQQQFRHHSQPCTRPLVWRHHLSSWSWSLKMYHYHMIKRIAEGKSAAHAHVYPCPCIRTRTKRPFRDKFCTAEHPKGGSTSQYKCVCRYRSGETLNINQYRKHVRCALNHGYERRSLRLLLRLLLTFDIKRTTLLSEFDTNGTRYISNRSSPRDP